MISTIISFHISVHLQVNSLEKVFEKWIKCKGRIKNNTNSSCGHSTTCLILLLFWPPQCVMTTTPHIMLAL